MLAFYPYATQPNGEFSYRAELIKKLKKETKLGGKYGTDITINFSGANGLDTTALGLEDTCTRLGYKVNYFGMGELFFSDFNIEIIRKFTPHFKLMLTYANQAYNKDVIEGDHGDGTIYSNIGMAELTFKMSHDRSVRWEIQHLFTEQDKGNWVQTLVEVGLNENWLVSVADMYNYGNEDETKRLNYYNATLVYIKNAMRVSLGYGRQRAGIFCVGGVCRYVPASNGFLLSVTSSF